MATNSATETVIAGRRARAVKNDDYRARRATLLEQAARLFYRRGVDETSLADIANAAGLDRATIYYYFSNKDEIVAEILREVLADGAKVLGDIATSRLKPDVKLHRMIVATMQLFERHYPHLFVYVRADIERSNISEELRNVLQRHARGSTALWQQVVDEGIRKGAFRQELPAEAVMHAIVGAVTSAHWWYRPGEEISATQLGEGLANLLVSGVCV
jgi:AcrR family transcriptional regulator